MPVNPGKDDTQRKRRKRSYDDQFRASAVLMLQSQGYPETIGALTHVAKHLKVPAMTLLGWFRRTSNPPPTNILTDKKQDLRSLYMNEIYAIMKVLPDKRNDASYGTLATAQGIFFDKIRLLDGLPTEIIQGIVTFIEVARKRGYDPMEAIRALINEMDGTPLPANVEVESDSPSSASA